MHNRLLLPLVAVLGCFLFTACDSGDPDDEPRPRDVAGEYRFTEFTFTPTSTSVQPIAVLDTLVEANTRLNLLSGGSFIFAYEFVGGEEYFLGGNFSVTERTVRIRGNENDREFYNQLLLAEDFNLRRDEAGSDVLSADVPLTVNPAEFSSRYEGILQLEGTLHLRLERQ